VGELIAQALQATRSLTFELSPPVLYELGFEPAVEWLTERMQEEHDLNLTFRDDGKPKPLDHELSVVLFKAVRELLHNVVKHSRARQAEVHISRRGDSIRVRIKDDGVGFEPEQGHRRRPDAGFGLFNIRERIQHFGGHVVVRSKPGRGTRVTLVAPLREAPEHTEEGDQ